MVTCAPRGVGTSSNIQYMGSAGDTNLDPICENNGSKDLKSMKKGSFGSKIKGIFIQNA